MAIQSQPSRISEPFAGSGTKNTIPAANAAPSASQAASWASGFPPECSQPISAGGCPVPRNDMNGVLNWLSQDFAFRQDGGIWEWSALADYDAHRLVRGSDGQFYVSVAQSGPGLSAGAQNPTTDTTKTYWKSFADLYVDLVSNQSIAGIKTFLNESVWRSTNNARQVMATSALSKGGTLPANRQGIANVQFSDASGKIFGQLECYVDATGTHLGFVAYPFNDPDNYTEANLLRVSMNHDGTKTASTYSPDVNANGDVIVTAGWVRSLLSSVISSYVDLSSNQQISGIKTFLNESVWRSTNNARQIMATSAISKGGTLPANRQGVANVQFDDANGKLFGQIECYVDTVGTHLGFIAYPFSDPDNYQESVSNLLRVSLYHNGTKSAYTYTPPANSAADEIATAAWVRSLLGSDASVLASMGRASMPSGQTVALTVPSAGDTVTMPGVGYLVAVATATAQTSFIYLSGGAVSNQCYGTSNGSAINLFIPVDSGASVTVGYSNVTWTGLYFVYAVGTVPA